MSIDLRTTRFLTSAGTSAGFPPDAAVEVAFAGRSNVGKSSALNRIVGRRALARTSKTPGRTQLINFFAVDETRRLVDLPGYGYARVPAEMKRRWQALLEGYLSSRKGLKGLMLIMDARHPLTAFDAQMLAWVAPLDFDVHVLLSKADKLSRARARNTLGTVGQQLQNRATVELFSATTGLGLDQTRAVLGRWFGA
jgi:GTP-binding protein